MEPHLVSSTHMVPVMMVVLMLLTSNWSTSCISSVMRSCWSVLMASCSSSRDEADTDSPTLGRSWRSVMEGEEGDH